MPFRDTSRNMPSVTIRRGLLLPVYYHPLCSSTSELFPPETRLPRNFAICTQTIIVTRTINLFLATEQGGKGFCGKLIVCLRERRKRAIFRQGVHFRESNYKVRYARLREGERIHLAKETVRSKHSPCTLLDNLSLTCHAKFS
jgi:hypothetical protein